MIPMGTGAQKDGSPWGLVPMGACAHGCWYQQRAGTKGLVLIGAGASWNGANKAGARGAGTQGACAQRGWCHNSFQSRTPSLKRPLHFGDFWSNCTDNQDIKENYLGNVIFFLNFISPT